ncbi:MAG: hypothetical protein HY766_16035 [candidate division NC10 bacterium]|nr:hypothetical protein [candidate division NC10 bacterium]
MIAATYVGKAIEQHVSDDARLIARQVELAPAFAAADRLSRGSSTRISAGP